MSFVVSFMGRATAPSSAYANGQVKLEELRQQWYARPASGLFAGNPCNFNAIGAFTGTRRASESRTEEQACRWRCWASNDAVDPQNHPPTNTVPRKIIRGARSGVPEMHPGRKRRALPEVEGLLE
jgi:hypothetical protein